MNRFYIAHNLHIPTVHDDDCPDAKDFGVYTYIMLDGLGLAGSDWNLMCLNVPSVEPCASWIPLPRVYDSKTLVMDTLPYNMLEDLGMAEDAHMTDLLDLLLPYNPLMLT